MNTYIVEHRIDTLLLNSVLEVEDSFIPHFEVGDLQFKHWDFSIIDNFIDRAWLVRGLFQEPNLLAAISNMRKQLSFLIPRITFLGQAYTTFEDSSFLAWNTTSSTGVAYLNFTYERKATPLMFTHKEKNALQRLIVSADVNEDFYLYWNDAVNTHGYTSKLLILFSALEALVKKPNGEKDWLKLEGILGGELKNKFFEPTIGLRHRLIHGEYFGKEDTQDYVKMIHESVRTYFNKNVLRSNLIASDIIGPQRHPFNNLLVYRTFIKKPLKPETTFGLRSVLSDVVTKGQMVNFKSYKEEWTAAVSERLKSE